MNKKVSITLSSEAFSHNIKAIAELRGDQSVALVIKANAYGHGINQIAALAQDNPSISFLCTAGINEALPLIRQGITKPLLVLSFLDGNLKEAVAAGLHMAVTSLVQAQALSLAAQSVDSRAFIHVKIDTGMGRLGLLPHEAVKTIRAMTQLPYVVVYGAFTHLSDTGHRDQSYSYKQLAVFDEVLDELAAAGITLTCTHAQSSSSLDLTPKRSYSFLRVGASAYGMWKNSQHRMLIKKIDPSFELLPVLELRAPIVQVKELPAGSFVGYQRTFVTQRPTKIAISSIGYADGYVRALSNKGFALCNGYKVPVIGIVSMNLTAFDVTDVPEVTEGNELILIGNYPGLRVHEVAQAAGCIANELATGLDSTLERIVVPAHEGALADVSVMHKISTAHL